MELLKINTMRNILIFLLSVNAALANGQTTDLSGEMKSRFPDESAVFLERSNTLNLFIEGDSLRAYTDVYEDLLHLKNQTDGYTNKKVYGSHFSQVENLRAKTLVWEKNRYRDVPVNGFKKSSQPRDDVFYDDSYYYSFNYPSVASGNRTQLQYRENQKDVRFISGYVFPSYVPQAKSSFVIKATRDVELFFQVLNDPEKRIQFKQTEKGKTVTYEWTAENVPTIRIEDNSPSIRYYEPHVICHIKSFKGKSGTVNVLPDVKSLHTWYQSFIRDLDEPDAPELVSVIKAIKQNSRSEEETVKQIFNWVQNNIQYIAFEQGMRGFVPHKASYTCDKRYGDCKDMANLIVGMLKTAGIKGYHTWIGTRDIPYRYSEIPTPLVDNHMIATYISPEGKYFFLDATDKYSPFGFPSAMTQGKEALISISADKYEIRPVPVIEKGQNLISDSLTLKLENNFLTGSGKFSMHGLSKASTGHQFERIEEKETRDFVLRMVGKGSNKFYLDKYQVNDQQLRHKPTRIDYTFRIGDYYQSVGDELYINLNLNKDNYNRFINEETRKTPHEFDFKYDKSEFIEFLIPEGYEMEYLPPNDSFNGKLMGYSITYTVSGNKILFSKTYYIDYLLLPPSEFKIWNDEVGRISNSYRETIILKKKK
jgi:hypothetical protein